MDTNRTRIRIAIVVGVVAAIVGIGTLISRALEPKASGTKIDQKIELSDGYSASAAYGENTVLTTNYQYFISHDYRTGEDKIVSADAGAGGLKNTDSLTISTNKELFLFHSSLTDPSSVLGTKLASLNLNQGDAYWWVYNTQTQEYNSLPASTTYAKLSGNEIYALTYGENGSYIKQYDYTGKELKSISVPPSSNFFPISNGFLLEGKGDNILFTKDGTVSTQLFKSTVLLAVSSDGKWGVATRNNKENTELIQLNLQDHTETMINNDMAGTVALYGDSIAYTTITQNTTTDNVTNIHTYNLDTQEYDNWDISDKASLKSDTTTYTIITYAGNDAMIVNDTYGKFYLVGKDLHK